MVVINIGMPRSGTLWRYNLIKALVIAAGGEDALKVRKQFLLQPFIGGVNADMNTLKAKRLAPALVPSLFGKSYVLNTHARPFALAKSLVSRGKLKAIYGYRDPRDCILSMLEYSERRLPMYSTNFLKLKTVEDAIEFMQIYMQAWEAWLNQENALVLRYEDMLTDFSSTADQIINYLDLKLESGQIDQIKTKFLPRQKPETGEQIHLHTGEAHRAKTEFSPEQLAELNEAYAPYLERMGYHI
jgi:hypothetical protein